MFDQVEKHMEEEEDMVKEGLMASPREIFSISGPIHLTSIDWYFIFCFISFIFNHISSSKIHLTKNL